MRISDWSSDVCSSDLLDQAARGVASEQGALWTSLHLDTAHVIEFRQGGNGRGHVDIVRIQRDRGFIRKAEIVQLYATDCHAGNDGCIGDLETRDQVAKLCRRVKEIGRASGRESVCQYV